ncbi:hypothetical protein os1_27160 [Comamonadaceae bacterium OS-1]|nr:hypothetical protein os1_27160 [Comamonadaceae bacterium OS-1]
MPANYEFSDLQLLLPFAPTDDSSSFPWQADPLGGEVIYLADDKGLWMRMPDENDPEMDFEAVTGFRLDELGRKKKGDFYIYTLKNGEALLPFPFTAAQLLELDKRTSGAFSEGINCGDKTDELIAEIAQRNPRAAELARAVVYREMPPELEAETTFFASVSHGLEPAAVSNAQAIDAPKFSMNRAALIAAHEHEWPTIGRDIADASTNGLDAAKAGARGWWEAQAMEWARAKGKVESAAKPVAGLAHAMNSMASITGLRHKL